MNTSILWFNDFEVRIKEMEKILEFCTAMNMTVKSYFFLTGKVAQPHMSLVHQKHNYIFLSLGETKENYEDIFVNVAKGMIMLR